MAFSGPKHDIPAGIRGVSNILGLEWNCGGQRKVLWNLLTSALKVTKADMGNVQILGIEGLRIEAQIGFQQPFLDYFQIVRDGSCACGAAKREGKRIIVENVADSPVFQDIRARQTMLDAGARAVQSTLLISRSGKLIGMLSTHFREPRGLSEKECRLLDVLTTLASPMMEASALLEDGYSVFVG